MIRQAIVTKGVLYIFFNIIICMNRTDVTKLTSPFLIIIILLIQLYIYFLCSCTQSEDGLTLPKHVAECGY
jgi:hypothetical protein